MIEADMKEYPYMALSSTVDEYGQFSLPTTATGSIRMNIQLYTQGESTDIRYSEAQYIGLTTEEVNDTYIIVNGTEKYKVLYANPYGRYKAAYLKEIG